MNNTMDERTLRGVHLGKAIADINWHLTYDALNMGRRFLEERESFNFVGMPNFWIGPVIKGLNCDRIITALRRLGVNVHIHAPDNDRNLIVHDRHPKDGSYTIKAYKNLEADQEYSNLSASMFIAKNQKGMTSLERLLFGLGYYVTTGQPLDRHSTTLCTGSRDRKGNVIGVRWVHGPSRIVDRVEVGKYGVDFSKPDLRARSIFL